MSEVSSLLRLHFQLAGEWDVWSLKGFGRDEIERGETVKEFVLVGVMVSEWNEEIKCGQRYEDVQAVK